MKNFCYYILIFYCFVYGFSSCAPGPYAGTNKIYKSKAKDLARLMTIEKKDSVVADSLKLPLNKVKAVNFGLRNPNFVIIHHTAQNSCEQTIQTFIREQSQVSAHYLICKDGTLNHLLHDHFRAWHAGTGKWGNDTDINSSSIGVEIDNNGKDSFSEAQLNTLMGLLAALKKNYNIPAANFIGHGDIAPSRKVDPQVSFPWQRLADSGYGLWYADTANIILPGNFNVNYGLRIIGYDVSNLSAATQAFRRHFLHAEYAGELSDPEKKVLYVLMQKYL